MGFKVKFSNGQRSSESLDVIVCSTATKKGSMKLPHESKNKKNVPLFPMKSSVHNHS